MHKRDSQKLRRCVNDLFFKKSSLNAPLVSKSESHEVL